MKKILLLLAFILCCVAYKSVYVQAEQIPNVEKHPIEIQQEKCMEKDYSTAGMNKCANEATEAWIKQISIYTELIKREIPAEQLPLFFKTQHDWQKYYNNEKKLIAKTVYSKDGTIHTNIATGMIQNLAKERALYLKSYLFELKD